MVLERTLSMDCSDIRKGHYNYGVCSVCDRRCIIKDGTGEEEPQFCKWHNETRKKNNKVANKRYQQTPNGRAMLSARMARYNARRRDTTIAAKSVDIVITAESNESIVAAV